MKYFYNDFAVVTPMANEEADFEDYVHHLKMVLDYLEGGKVYFIIDKASKDSTLELSRQLSTEDSRFVTVWAPENKNVVDAYLRGLREAYEKGHELIIEMDAGMSHDPRAIPMFLRVLNEGNECAFGSRFINGGSMSDSIRSRKILSRTGTLMSKIFLGSRMFDMTSGFQGFHSSIVKQILQHPFRSKAHFYQTELRYLLRKKRYLEIPIHYRAPSKRVSGSAIRNALSVLFYYFFKRITFKTKSL
jgi:dolichol-phosphate mannosyltransferase